MTGKQHFCYSWTGWEYISFVSCEVHEKKELDYCNHNDDDGRIAHVRYEKFK